LNKDISVTVLSEVTQYRLSKSFHHFKILVHGYPNDRLQVVVDRFYWLLLVRFSCYHKHFS